MGRWLRELGLTSLDAVDCAGTRRSLGAHLARPLPQTLAFDHPTVNALMAHFVGQPQVMPAQASPSIPVPPPGAGGDLEELLSMIEGGARGGQ